MRGASNHYQSMAGCGAGVVLILIDFGSKSIATVVNVPLEYAPVFRGCVEVQVHGIAWQVNMHYVWGANDNEPAALHALALHVNLFFCDRDI